MRSLFCITASTIALFTFSVACTKTPAAQTRTAGENAVKVKAAPVEETTIHRELDVVGTLAAEQEVTVAAQAEGTVSRLLVDLGDPVHAGQTLIELDREKSEYTVDEQKATLARVLARYGASDPAHLPPIEQTPDVQKAKAEMVQAQQSFDRAEELHRRQLLPRQALDDAQAMLASKQAAYQSALQSARDLRAQIDGSVATTKLSERQLRDTSIKAPFDGYVQKRLVSLGEFVKAQAPVISIVRVDPLKVTAELPEKMAPWVSVGQEIQLSVDAYPDRQFTGRVSRVSPAVNPATRAFPFEALVANHDTAAPLKPGTFARVHIGSSKIDHALTIPYSAIQYRYGVNRAFVIDGDRVVSRELKVGERSGDRIEVLEGLKAGESVAVGDIDRLNDGVRVAVAR
jgi:HlyD family secretion protein